MLIHADARQLPLRDGCVDCVITSPPYWGLRDYGTARWDGGDPACAHTAGRFARGGLSAKQASNAGSNGDETFREACPICGARRVDAQIGLEGTPADYVATLVAVFREVWRVLKPTGTAWVNLGDCYANDGKWGGETGGKQAYLPDADWRRDGREKRITGLKPKDLVGIPWRVAFALRADGWYLRSDIVWSKPNPMPESVTDLPTKSHEYLFLLAKSERYYFDAAAIAEPSIHAGRVVQYNGTQKNCKAAENQLMRTRIDQDTLVKCERNRRSVWTVNTEPFSGWTYDFAGADYVDGRGIPHKWSPDCPVHARDGQPRQRSRVTVSCDAPPVARLTRRTRSDAHHVQASIVADVPIAHCKEPLASDSPSDANRGNISLNKTAGVIGEVVCETSDHTRGIQSESAQHTPDSCRREDADSASVNNTGTSKSARVPQSDSCDTADGEPSSHRPYMPLLAIAGDESNPPNNSAVSSHDSVLPAPAFRSVRTLSSESARNNDTCACSVSQYSHFAVMPEALVEPCILAGCPAGGLVLDPFCGTGTVLAVAERLDRRGVGVDLAYQGLARERTAQRGLRFTEVSA